MVELKTKPVIFSIIIIFILLFFFPFAVSYAFSPSFNTIVEWSLWILIGIPIVIFGTIFGSIIGIVLHKKIPTYIEMKPNDIKWLTVIFHLFFGFFISVVAIGGLFTNYSSFLSCGIFPNIVCGYMFLVIGPFIFIGGIGIVLKNDYVMFWGIVGDIILILIGLPLLLTNLFESLIFITFSSMLLRCMLTYIQCRGCNKNQKPVV
jgi:hypothetical protein